MKILVVEDNENIREAVTSFLILENFIVDSTHNISIAKKLLNNNPDLIILDIMLPDGNGYHFAKYIRELSNVPIIFLTAKDSESERIKGFEVGADDYVTKPFSVKELVLRVNAVLRRAVPKNDIEHEIMQFKKNGQSLSLNLKLHTISLTGKILNLTPTEWSLLKYLIDNRDIILDKERILESCLGYSSDSSDRVIITHIKNIREKLGDKEWIETIRGFGYRFCGEE
ncbi:MAG: response regulator transcription factor [Spirochaetaceae bacterium]